MNAQLMRDSLQFLGVDIVHLIGKLYSAKTKKKGEIQSAWSGREHLLEQTREGRGTDAQEREAGKKQAEAAADET